MIRISIDLMGGENAPYSILKAASKFKDVHFIFSGLPYLEKEISNNGIKNYSFISADIALKDGIKYSFSDLKMSSLYQAVEQVNSGNADAVVSSGPTGYYFLIAKKLLNVVKGMHRIPIASLIPTDKGKALMLDLGANIECNAETLFQFALAGKTLAEFFFEKKIKTGFVNLGHEETKGPDYIKEAVTFFKMYADQDNYFIEPNLIFKGNYDVIVCDGFLGNCLLKTMEGSATFFKSLIKKAFLKNIFSKLIGFFVYKILKKNMIDPRVFNGGLFLGMKKCAVKSHGSSDKVAFESAIRFAIKSANSYEKVCTLLEDVFTKVAK